MAKSPGDGYTLMTMHQGLAFNAALYSNLQTTRCGTSRRSRTSAPYANVLVVTDVLPARTLKEFLDYARRNPGRIAYGSGGVGSAGHLPVELLQSLTGTRLTHVPYKGSGPALTDLVGGQIQAMLATMPAAMPFVKSGKVRAIATSGAQRSPALPELPTIAEAGVPGYEYMPWYGLFGPATLPRALAERLHQAAVKALRGSRPAGAPGAAGTRIPRDHARAIRRAGARRRREVGQVIRDAGVRAE